MKWLFDTAPFVPRGRCGYWPDWMAHASQMGDIGFFLAYSAIPITIAVLWKRRRNELAKPWILLCFCAFILLCGLTHLNDVLVFVWPAYRYFVVVKLAGAAVSIVTAALMPGVVKFMLKLPSPEFVHAMNNRLMGEVARRKVAELEREQQTGKVIDSLEARLAKVEDRAWSVDQEADIRDIRRMIDDIRRGPIE